MSTTRTADGARSSPASVSSPPTAAGTDAFWKATQEGHQRPGPGHPRGLRASAAAGRGRGPRLRPGGADRGALPRPDRPVHPLRDGRGRSRAGRRRARPGRRRAPPFARRRGDRRRLRRRRVRPARTAAAVGPGAALSSARTSPSPGSTRPAPARSPSAAASRAPAGWWPATRPAVWTPSRTPPGHPARHRRGGRRRRRGTAGPVLGGLPARLRGAQHRATDPTGAYLPFTAGACGFVPGRGRRHARGRGRESAPGRGGAPSGPSSPGTRATFTGASRWEESREGLAQAIRGALREARLRARGGRRGLRRRARHPGGRPRRGAGASPTRSAPHGRQVPVTAPKTGIGRAYCGAPAAGHRRRGARHGARPGAAHPERLRRLP